jgi:2-amino-4-hydroxy-6-hydroxymethyldihydropteridine diphosphokinase
MNTCYILLGSNLEDRLAYLKDAKEKLSQTLKLINSSSIYETSAWGNENQSNYYNQVLVFHTTKSPIELLQLCLTIETQMGRIRTVKWADRIIDIDVLYYNDEIIVTNDLKVPHPLIQDRRFVLTPLTEIAPHYKHPVWNKTNLKLLNDCNDPLEVKKIG